MEMVTKNVKRSPKQPNNGMDSQIKMQGRSDHSVWNQEPIKRSASEDEGTTIIGGGGIMKNSVIFNVTLNPDGDLKEFQITVT